MFSPIIGVQERSGGRCTIGAARAELVPHQRQGVCVRPIGNLQDGPRSPEQKGRSSKTLGK